MSYGAVIVGCGMIAGGYDELPSSDQGAVLTHAKALKQNPHFEILACVESDDSRREAFMSRWDIPDGYSDLHACLGSLDTPDLVCICTPNETHAEILDILSGSGVKAVFCEKPITTNLADARQIVRDYSAHDILLAVNYVRRWNESIISLRDEIIRGDLGPLLSFYAQYTGGLLNNGSHMLDLLVYLFDGVEPLGRLRHSNSANHDHSCDALLRIPSQNAVGSMISCDKAAFGLFEISLCFEKSTVSLIDWSREMQTRRPITDPLAPDRLILGPVEKIETGWRKAQANSIDNIHRALTTGAALNSDGASALVILEICDALVKMPVMGEA